MQLREDLTTMTEIPLKTPRKRNEWEKKAIIIGAIGGLNAAIWGILANYWMGLI